MNSTTELLSMALLARSITAARPAKGIVYDRVWLASESWRDAVGEEQWVLGKRIRLLPTRELLKVVLQRNGGSGSVDDYEALLIPEDKYADAEIISLDLSPERTAEIEKMLYSGDITVVPVTGDYQYWQTVHVDGKSPAYRQLDDAIHKNSVRYSGSCEFQDGTYLNSHDGSITIYNPNCRPDDSMAARLARRGTKIDTAALRAAADKDLRHALVKEARAAQLEKIMRETNK